MKRRKFILGGGQSLFSIQVRTVGYMLCMNADRLLGAAHCPNLTEFHFRWAVGLGVGQNKFSSFCGATANFVEVPEEN